MPENNSERYTTPEGVDTSLEASRSRLIELQPSLQALMTKALVLFDDTYPNAPHPSDDPQSAVYAVHTANTCPVERIPMGRELTIVLGSGKWIRVFRNTDTSPDSFPRQRLWFWQPVEAEISCKVNVIRTHNPSREQYPYDIETTDHNANGMHLGSVNGAPYYGQEPFIADAGLALDDARQIAEENGFLIKE